MVTPKDVSNWFGEQMRELDNFIDDAAGRRLGQGSKFYGKRRSNFYGPNDPQRKKNPYEYDREEDYIGPMTGQFMLTKERDEKGRPMGSLSYR